MKIGIIKEGKTPPDSRVPITPTQAALINQREDVQIVIQPSPSRCYTDEEYQAAGVPLSNDLSDCDVLMGVKEVPIKELVADKKYFFFSHTFKEQPYNRGLLQAVVSKNIQLIDYEVLTNERKQRLIAFGRWAGIVGAHNGIMTYGNRTKAYELAQMKHFKDFAAAKDFYKNLELPAMKIVLTGMGRVASGSAEVLEAMGIRRVSPSDFVKESYSEAVFTQLDCVDYAARKDGSAFDLQHFFKNPAMYQSIFAPFTKVADLMINGIYWDNDAPVFFTTEEMKSPDFSIKAIADVTCDIAPVSSIPSTLFAATIAKPVFGFDVNTGEATEPYQAHTVDMMTIDNLPNELPRDASQNFGEQFVASVLEELLTEGSDVIRRASMTKNGDLTAEFEYLRDYLNGE
jgi:saccharopine dehydrogenase (NAD+, L-lysine-forming)